MKKLMKEISNSNLTQRKIDIFITHPEHPGNFERNKTLIVGKRDYSLDLFIIIADVPE